jgi:hypothetical protein
VMPRFFFSFCVKYGQVRCVFRFSYLECVNYVHAFLVVVANMADTVYVAVLLA